MESQTSEVEMYVAGLVLDPASNAPIVILKTGSGDVCLPIWIGLSEARAIASAIKKEPVIRPMTHDLLRNLIEEVGCRVSRIAIVSLEDNTFYANIELVLGDVVRVIDSRPSDAIALAVRVGAPIMVAAEVLAKAQVTLVAVNPAEAEEQAKQDAEEVFAQPEQETESQNFANIEKDKWAEILADMDPDDFKYKM